MAGLNIPFRFALRELRGGLRGFRIFLACLTLGVAAIAAIGTVRAAIETGLEREGATLLGGDAELDFTYRFANDEERAWMDANAAKYSEIADFRSMAVVTHSEAQIERALTQVKAVDQNYPLIGEVGLDPQIPLAQALAGQGDLPGAVMHKELIDRLGVELGAEFALGAQSFVLMAVLTDEPDSSAGGFGLGPRSIVRLEDLENSGLLSAGTLFNSKYRLELSDNAELSALETEARTRFEQSGMRWSDARNAAPGIAEFVERLSAFLILVGLSGLAVGGIGISSAVSAYLARKTTVIAILRTLGAQKGVIFATYFIQIGALSLLGIAMGLALGASIPLLLASVLEARLPIPAAFRLFPLPLIEAAIYGILTAFIFTLWPLARAEDIQPAQLFRDALGSARAFPAGRYVISTVLALTVLIGLAAFFSGSWLLTFVTAGAILASLAVLTAAAFGLRMLAGGMKKRTKHFPALRWALGAIWGGREGPSAVVLSLGLGLAVLSAIGQIDGNLRNAISGNLPEIAPSYFFVDIQRDQMPGYLEKLEAQASVKNVESAPMLRGVITQINGVPAREIAGDHWVLSGDRGITYSAEPPRDTIITAGRWWNADYQGPPQISFAAEEALEMGLKLGDQLTVNVLGRNITGEITSFREVDFSTAGIGFILSMNPSALEGAPHSFISTVYSDAENEAAILRDIASTYPNITAIRVRDAIDRVSNVLAGVAAATSYGALAALLTGFLVLIGAAAAGTQARIYEAAILRTLGASRARILMSFILRAAILGLGAGLIALFAGIAGGWAVSRFVMQTDFSIIWGSALAIVIGGIIATLCAGIGFAWRPISARPAHILRGRE